MTEPIVPEGTNVTFSDYFKLNAYVEDVLASFGYSYQVKGCDLPRKEIAPARLAELRTRLEEVLPHVNLATETARREFLIALDRWAQDSSETRFYGAVSMGNGWQFGYVERTEKRIVADFNVYPDTA